MGISPSTLSSSSSSQESACQRYVSFHHQLLPLLSNCCGKDHNGLPMVIIQMIMEYAYISTLILFGASHGQTDQCLMWQPHVHQWLPFFGLTFPADTRSNGDTMLVYQNHLMMLGPYGNSTLDLSVITSTSTPLRSTNTNVTTAAVAAPSTSLLHWQSMPKPHNINYIIAIDYAVVLEGTIYGLNDNEELVSWNASPSSRNQKDWKLLDGPSIEGRRSSTLVAIDSYTNTLTGEHVDGYLLRIGGMVPDGRHNGRPLLARNRVPPERYHPMTNTWSVVDERHERDHTNGTDDTFVTTRMTQGLCDPYVFVIPGHSIIMVGGTFFMDGDDKRTVSDEVFQWDLCQSKWLCGRPNWKIANISHASYFAYIPHDKLYMIGTSTNEIHHVWSLDLHDPHSTWQQMVDLPHTITHMNMQPVIWDSFANSASHARQYHQNIMIRERTY
jgi:hypothetical protein